MSDRGLIFDVQRFSTHDGPGIRTTVFFKGCPLRCKWCQNPEGLRPYAEATVDPTGLETSVGRWVTVAELLEELVRDLPFYRASGGGGVTLSGGEPTAQLPFVVDLARACRDEGLSVGLQTSGAFRWDAFEPALPLFDFIHYDLKAIDPQLHRTLTRADNRVILDNARRLAQAGAPVCFRRPVVPGLNDGEAELTRLARFLEDLGSPGIELLAYHRSGESKLERLGFPLEPLGIAGGDHALACLERAAEYLRGSGLQVAA